MGEHVLLRAHAPLALSPKHWRSCQQATVRRNTSFELPASSRMHHRTWLLVGCASTPCPALPSLLLSLGLPCPCRERRRVEAIPGSLAEAAEEKRKELVECLSEVDDDIAEKFLNDEPISPEDLQVGSPSQLSACMGAPADGHVVGPGPLREEAAAKASWDPGGMPTKVGSGLCPRNVPSECVPSALVAGGHPSSNCGPQVRTRLHGQRVQEQGEEREAFPACAHLSCLHAPRAPALTRMLALRLRRLCLGSDPAHECVVPMSLFQGVQLLLDGVVDYLPCPTDVSNHALDQSKAEEKVSARPGAKALEHAAGVMERHWA